MITINMNGNQDPELFLVEHASDIMYSGIDAIIESMEVDIDEALVAEIITTHDDGSVETVDFCIPKSNWLDFLAKSIEGLLEDEEYGKIVKVREAMRKLQ